MLNRTVIGTLKEHSSRQRLVLPAKPDEASVISIAKYISISISITEMCDQFDFHFDCLDYFNFNFNTACISIISISIVETRFVWPPT